ncbi:hypothetical protein EDD11_003123 [Mortierella claussenii]|nr:hypothetical protein EDD11_003123 [Mortierella claussenii]
MFTTQAAYEDLDMDEFLRREGLTEEEYKRIYELRYCTILVPFEEKRVKHESKTKVGELLEEHPPSTPTRNKEQKQLATPKSAQKHGPSTVSNRKNTPTYPTGLLTPDDKRRRHTTTTSQHSIPRSQCVAISDDQEEDIVKQEVLTIHDPLSSYLTSVSSSAQHHTIDTARRGTTIITAVPTEDEEMNTADPETFHDALDVADVDNEEGPACEQAEKTGSSNAGAKRRRWELEISTPLLKQRQPSSAKRVALSVSKSVITTTTTFTSATLLKPRSFTPTQSPLLLPRCGSESSNVSSVVAQGALWSTHDWKALEAVYNSMEAKFMTEADLGHVADRFLAQREAQIGDKPTWSREKVLTRCVALHRVRNNVQKEPALHAHKRELTPLSTGPRGVSRHSAQPYPVQRMQRSSSISSTTSSAANGLEGGSNGTSSSAISDFLSHRRADRSLRQRTEDQGYQLKSVFRHRLASGLRTVGQLLPYWRDVEQGKADIKEKIKVALVPAGKAQSVIESFESKSQGSVESRCGSSFPRSRSNSAASNRSDLAYGASGPRLSDGSAESVAELIAQGHAAHSRAASAMSSNI